MKILKHGRKYIDKTKPFIVKCDCGCEFETFLDECNTISCASFYDFYIGKVSTITVAKCPECGAEIEITDESIRKI